MSAPLTCYQMWVSGVNLVSYMEGSHSASHIPSPHMLPLWDSFSIKPYFFGGGGVGGMYFYHTWQDLGQYGVQGLNPSWPLGLPLSISTFCFVIVGPLDSAASPFWLCAVDWNAVLKSAVAFLACHKSSTLYSFFLLCGVTFYFICFLEGLCLPLGLFFSPE